MKEATSSTIRVIVADDHAVVREGIRSYLWSQPDIEVVGEAADGSKAIELARIRLPHVLVVDITMPRMSGIEVARTVASLCPGVRVLIVTMHHDDRCLAEAIRAGAAGYLLKDVGPEDLLLAIKRVHAGEAFVTDGTSRLLFDQAQLARVSGPRPPRRDITRREREILSCLVKGLTSKEIALQLKLSARTVDGHRAKIKTKLGLRTSADLVRYALAHGLRDSS